MHVDDVIGSREGLVAAMYEVLRGEPPDSHRLRFHSAAGQSVLWEYKPIFVLSFPWQITDIFQEIDFGVF